MAKHYCSAVTDLFLKHRKKLMMFAKKELGKHELAEEVLQDLFILAIEQSINETITREWLFSRAWGLAKNKRRKEQGVYGYAARAMRRRENAHSVYTTTLLSYLHGYLSDTQLGAVNPWNSTPEDQHAEQELRALIAESLTKLDAKQRFVIESDMRELGDDFIAQRLNINPGYVRVIRYRAHRALVPILGEGISPWISKIRCKKNISASKKITRFDSSKKSFKSQRIDVVNSSRR